MFFPFKNYRVNKTAFSGTGDILLETMTTKALISVEWYRRSGTGFGTGVKVHMVDAAPLGSTAVHVDIALFGEKGNYIVHPGSQLKIVTDGDWNAFIHIFELPTI